MKNSNLSRAVLLATVASWHVPSALAQSSSVPSPSQFHGYELGTTYTNTAALYDYYRELARRSPRVEYREYGRSIQGHPLPVLLIGSESHLAVVDNIQTRVRQLTDVTDRLSEGQLASLVSEIPAVVGIFIVDTDEEAGVEVLQEVAYDLATRETPDVRAIRENVLVIIAPLTNPDSHARYVSWHKLYDVEGASVDPNAVENRAHWGMNTDGNAYGIDVNRDFGWFVSPEMQAFAREVMRWHPQLMLDVHSGPNVIFIPPFPPPHHPLWPSTASKWWEALAQRAAENFGRRGWSFNTREGYEGVTSVGFGLSWVMLGPAVSSFLFESFGGRPGKTIAFRRSDGTIATMRMAMDRHAEGIWSLLQVASERREELLRDAHEMAVVAVDQARSSTVRTVVIPAGGSGVDPDKVNRLIERLTLQEVRVERARESFTVRARDFYDLEADTRQHFESGSYLVDLVQPRARLARTLLDPTIDDGRPQVLIPYGRSMPYYDVTWEALPYLFGVPAYASSEAVGVERQAVSSTESRPGAVVRIERAEPPYAYLLPPGRESSYRIAIRLMSEGYRLRVSHSWFQLGERRYAKGTVVAIRQRNPEGLAERLAALADTHGGNVTEVASSFTDAGVAFGDDRRLAAIPAPLVAVLADWPVTQDHTFGGIRTVLQADFGFAFSPVMLETINERDLSKYTAVVLPHAGMDIRGGPGFSRGYRGQLNMENLRRYVTGGGTLVAVQGSAAMLAEDPVLGQDVAFEGWAEHANGAALRARWESGPEPESRAVTWRPGLDRVGLPLLAAGYPEAEWAAPGAYPVLLDVAEGGRAWVVARYTDDAARLVLDGFVLDSDRERLAGRPFVVVQPAGRGTVIYFAGDPTFRGYWYGLNMLFLNCLIFGPTL
ncbi:MAG: hypothetical protein GTO22_25920 [Gemmatimonadales bacterium]|nr:hypothetical protein [Gemmatimonadales bacterium]